MNLLFDTHIFIWWDSEPQKLSASTMALCQDKTNVLYLSTASVWEIQLKHQLGKLELHQPLEKIIAEQQQIHGLKILPVELPHIYALRDLPMHHKDPFDRLLIAQARAEKMTLLSVDPMFASYPVSLRG